MRGKNTERAEPVPLHVIQQRILLIRGQKVLIDSDLASLYRVDTKALTRAAKRNLDRFPSDFMFQLSPDEAEHLRRQFGASTWGGRRYAPYAFTEQGVAMLSSVLRSKRAVLVNVEIMRAFVRLRQILASNAELARKLEALRAPAWKRRGLLIAGTVPFLASPWGEAAPGAGEGFLMW